MYASFFTKHSEIIKTIKDRYILIILYLSIVIFLGLTESFGIAILFPIAELSQDQEVVIKYLDIVYNYTGYRLRPDALILTIFASAFTLFLLSGILQLISFRVAAILLDGLYSSWQQKIFGYYLNAKYSFFSESMSGDMVQKLMMHSEKAAQVVSHFCIIFKETILLIFISLVLVSLSFKLTMYLFIVGVIFTVVSIIFGKLNIFNASNKIAEHQKKSIALAAESINAIKLIKIYVLENYFNNKFTDEINKRARFLIYNQSFINAPGVILRTLTLLIMLTALFVITRLSNDNISQTISFLIVFAGAGYKINGSIGAISNAVLSLANVTPSLVIISKELSTHYFSDNLKKTSLSKIKFNDTILFKEVSFKYKFSNETILDKINLQIKKRSLVGIVGESGSGKSTIVDLILKLYEADSGQISIDNKDIKQVNSGSWRESISYVGQDIQILSGTILSNITLNFEDPLVKQQKLSEATDIADIEGYIMNLPNQYNTKISENGDNISAGQKQRIAISRAIYHNPQVIIFDEATSNLSYSSEKIILRKLIAFCKKNGTTLIHVTHRTDILSELDYVIYISEGKIIAQDKHADLLTKSSKYFDFIEKGKLK